MNIQTFYTYGTLNFIILCHSSHAAPELTCAFPHINISFLAREEWILVTTLSMGTTIENTINLKIVLIAVIFPRLSTHFYGCIFF